MVGHAGVGIYGSILGGLASASAWAELNGAVVFAMPLEFTMCGSIGLEACVLIFCAEWNGTMCFGTGGMSLD